MKIGMLAVSVIGLSFICTAFADDLPQMGYTPGTPVKDLVAKGYRWVTVNCLIRGTLVRVIRDDQANGMSEILLGGITRPLWTYTNFLTARPIHGTYGMVETPDTAGLIDPSDRAVMGSALNERSRGGTP